MEDEKFSLFPKGSAQAELDLKTQKDLIVVAIEDLSTGQDFLDRVAAIEIIESAVGCPSRAALRSSAQK